MIPAIGERLFLQSDLIPYLDRIEMDKQAIALRPSGLLDYEWEAVCRRLCGKPLVNLRQDSLSGLLHDGWVNIQGRQNSYDVKRPDYHRMVNVLDQGPKMTTPSETLSQMLATATADDQRAVLEAAFVEWFPDSFDEALIRYPRWRALCCAFHHMIGAGAFVDAALLLLREVLPGYSAASGTDEDGRGDAIIELPGDDNPQYDANAATQALAIVEAIMQAKEAGNG
jgi:hypothetical protein